MNKGYVITLDFSQDYATTTDALKYNSEYEIYILENFIKRTDEMKFMI